MTKKFKKILVGVDDSSDALAAFEYALHWAKADNASLIITSILEFNDINIYQSLSKEFMQEERNKLEQRINEYIRRAQEAGIANVRAVIDEGNPGKTIIDVIIPQYQPDLLIIGAKSQNPIAKHFGSQAAYMAKNADISVLIVREQSK